MSLHSKAPNAEKGKRYLAQLDQALCNGSWAEVPELARKTDKHAPERKCFTLTARTEAQIASASHRPTSASSTGIASIHSLSDAIPRLQEAIAAASSGPEESYCASACLGEVCWLQEDPVAALKALPRGNAPSETSSSHTAPLGWVEVCGAKSSFLRAAALEATGQEKYARAIYQAAVSQTLGSRTPELRRWTERLIARACVSGLDTTRQPSIYSMNEALLSYRAWASFWQRAPPPAVGSGINASRVDVPRRQIWKAYYELLSSILRHGLVYNPSTDQGRQLLIVPWTEISNERLVDAKARQRAELKRVEATYESLLLNETQFPKASESNSEVEEWVEQAVGNWRVLCGGDWTDSELGEGGKEAVGRGMLDILYRAATKTFHSSAILRQLFTVHAAIGEFELAVHAFNSYVEIVGRGKARAEKTGKHELGFDSDDIALFTAAEAVRVLCKYGDREQGEKAMEVSNTIQKWLGPQRPPEEQGLETSEDTKVGAPEPPSHPTYEYLRPKTVAAAYRAMGIGHAHWARLTSEDDRRGELYAQALEYLQRAISFDGTSVETAFALARVLADTQDVPAALEIIRRTIAFTQNAGDNGSYAGTDTQSDAQSEEGAEDMERQLIPIWHLLALCLTAQDEYEPAMRMCDAAFNQFGDSSELFGRSGSQADPEKQNRITRGLVDQMDNFERETVLQVKMSQLTFMELTEGIESAVESSNEVLALYARLFRSPAQLKAPTKAPPPTVMQTPPSRNGGTLRSIAGSIRPRSARNSPERDTTRQASHASTAPRSSTGSGGASANANGQLGGSPIAITVTNEDGVSSGKSKHEHHHHLHIPFNLKGHHGDHPDTGSVRSKKSAEQLRRSSLNDYEKPLPVPLLDSDVTDHAHSAANPPAIEQAVNHSMSPETPAKPQQPLKEMQHNAPHDAWPEPAGHGGQPPEQDLRLPAPHPASNAMPLSHFGSLQERQHRISVLVNVWLFVAGLYIRAEMYEDAGGAVDEALSFVETFEVDKGAEQANARKLFEKGWGGGRSVDELWGDVYSAKGDLASALDHPFEAMSHYEQALDHFPDHAEGIIGLSNLLMDIYEEKMPAEEPQPLLAPMPTSSGSLISDPTLETRPSKRPTTAKSTLANAGRELPPSAAPPRDPTPAQLNRLAARDRAYMLLSNLTKLGTGYDNAEAWYTLARAHELSKEVSKAKQSLWWVVELENSRSMRPWSVVSPGGYAL